MTQTLTLSCKLKATEAQTAKLTATLSAFTQALNWVNANTPAQTANALKLQTYGTGLFCSLVGHNRLRATESPHRTAKAVGVG